MSAIHMAPHGGQGSSRSYRIVAVAALIVQWGAWTQAETTWKGTLAGDTVWDPNQGPHRVSGELVVPKDTTLSIRAGTTVHFSAGARILIQGCLTAQGTEDAPIRFNGTAAGYHWRGLQFDHTMADSQICHAVLEDGQTNDGMIGLQNSQLLLDHVTLRKTHLRRIRTLDSSLTVRNCTFGDMFDPNEPPSTDNMSEHIWGSGIPDGGRLIIEDSTFGRCTGHNDAIDFDGPSWPKPIPVIRRNMFLGGGDDALDLEADALIEGNTFRNFMRDAYNKASGESNILSAGAGKSFVMSHNLCINVQHVSQVKNGAFLTFANNTVVNVSGAAIYLELGLVGRKPGRGAEVRECIFWQTPMVVAGTSEDFRIDYSLLASPWHGLGEGNIDADPCFASPGLWDPNGVPLTSAGAEDYHLKSQAGRWSPALQEWVLDETTSPCIDAGDPNSPVAEEPVPNGGRVNLGAHGGTAQASKSYP